MPLIFLLMSWDSSDDPTEANSTAAGVAGSCVLFVEEEMDCCSPPLPCLMRHEGFAKSTLELILRKQNTIIGEREPPLRAKGRQLSIEKKKIANTQYLYGIFQNRISVLCTGIWPTLSQ